MIILINSFRDRSKSGCGKEKNYELSCHVHQDNGLLYFPQKKKRQWIINSCLQDMSTEELVVQLE